MGLERTQHLQKFKMKSTYTNRKWKWLIQIWTKIDTPLSSLMDSIASPKVTKIEGEKVGGALLGSQHFEGRGVRWSSGMKTLRLTSKSITHTDLYKPNNKLISA
jgi:hypothetical protein